MWRSIALSGIVSVVTATGCLAQEVSPHGEALHRLAFTSRNVAAERQALCDHATSVVARAGLSNAVALSREQLFSLFLVMSLQSHSSQQHS
jgi:hypothetical protein